MGRRGGVVRRRAGGVRRGSTRRPRPSTPSTARAGPPGRSTPRTPRGTRRCPSPGTRSPPPSPWTTTTYGYKWAKDAVTTAGEGRAARDPPRVLPAGRRTRRAGSGGRRSSPKDVPAETGLAKAEFPKRRAARTGGRTSPPTRRTAAGRSRGRRPARSRRSSGDGSVVTYYWYRFADQPALLNADLTADEREALQKRVELLHKNWTKDREYLPPPTVGKLADLDPAVLVTPPKGLEVGYVPDRHPAGRRGVAGPAPRGPAGYFRGASSRENRPHLRPPRRAAAAGGELQVVGRQVGDRLRQHDRRRRDGRGPGRLRGGLPARAVLPARLRRGRAGGAAGAGAAPDRPRPAGTRSS